MYLQIIVLCRLSATVLSQIGMLYIFYTLICIIGPANYLRSYCQGGPMVKQKYNNRKKQHKKKNNNKELAGKLE